MKEYQIQTVLSSGHKSCNPVQAEGLEAVKKIIAEKRAVVEKEILKMYPGETVIATEIYELVRVATVNVR